MPLIQLFVKGIEGKTTAHMIDQAAEVAKIFAAVADRVNIPVEEIRLIFGGKELRSENEHGKAKYLTDYKITNHSTLFMTMRLPGGSNNIDDGKRIGRFLTSKPKLSKDPDIITYENDPAHPRGLMPCGHAIGPCSLYEHLKCEVYTKASHEIKCPICPAVWDYPVVRDYAALTDEEREDFETRLALNYLQKHCKAQQCPECQTYCERKQENNARVVCTICTRAKSRNFEFCWFCLHEWKGGNTTDCGNNDCSRSGQLYLLNHCGTKEIVGVPNCPTKRACPWCFTIIEHDHACKHMHCKMCMKEFCFICLSKKVNGVWSCGSYNSKCTVAPIQRTLN